MLDPETGDTLTAEIGDTVTLSAGVNRDDVLVSYQWQRMQLPMPTEAVVNTDAVNEYPEDAPTWYAFPLSDVSEAEALAQNPDMTWSGMEMYLAAKEALEKAGLDSSDVSFTWQTPNYALDGYAISAVDNGGVIEIHAEKDDELFIATRNEEGKFGFAAASVSASEAEAAAIAAQTWEDIEGAVEPSYTFTVAEEDHYAQYRLKVTILDEEYLSYCISVLEEQGVELTDEQKAEDQVLYSIVMKVQSGIVEEETFVPEEPIAGIQFVASLFAANSQPYLSEDGQWICGLNGNYQYITEDAYNRAMQWYKDGKINWTQFNYYWTYLNPLGWNGRERANVLDSNGLATGAYREYNGFDLTDGHMLEVASEWYGKTVYFRVAGTTNYVAIEIPAYTELYGDGDKYNEAASGSKYKKAIVFLNPFPADTPPMYEMYLNRISNAAGWLYEGDTVSGVTATTTDLHIQVKSVNAESFNADPQRYMVDAEGNYRVDSVGWGVCTYDEPDISGKAYWVLKDYISQGYGFMTGHDTMYAYAGAYYDAKLGADLDESAIDPNDGTTWYYNLNSWVPGTTAHDPNGNTSTTRGGHFYVNELMGSNSGNVYSGTTVPSDAPSLILSTGGSHGKYEKRAMFGTQTLRVATTGYSATLAKVNPRYRTPTNYPYIFSNGQQIGAALTHTNGQAAFGTIWVDYAGRNMGADLWGAYENPLYWTVDGKTGTNNFYLSGDGNYLMNQIGHLPTNEASSNESMLFANSVMFVSQRKQCEICAANQNGQQTSHFVRRISAANSDAVLTALQNGGSYWYPLDGCYMLTEDITLPEDWTPIQGFNGHWNSDVYEVNLNSKGTPLLANDSADGESGWNLGTDQTKGVETVFNAGMARTTGVARVVGDLNDLFGTSTNYAGYTVKILGSDNPKYMTADEVYSCEVNGDSKYVISNLPCLYDGAKSGILVARVYDTAGTEVTQYGSIIASIPQEFWNTDETVPLDLLDLTALPPEDRTIWVSQEADYTATILTSGYEYSEAKITWQYKAPGSNTWVALNATQDASGKFVHKSNPVMKNGYLTHDFLGTTTKLAGQPFQYEIVHLGYVDTGDITTTGTQTKLRIINAPLTLDEFEFRIVYQGSGGQNLYSNVDPDTGAVKPGAKLFVLEPQMDSTMSNTQTLFMISVDKNGGRVDNTYPGDRWQELFNRTYDRVADENGVPYNNGNNVAEYVSEVLYLPHLSDNNVPDITWKYRNGNSTTEVPFFTATYNSATKTWSAQGNSNYTAFVNQYPGLKISVKAEGPIAVDEDGTPNPNGQWRKVITTMTLDGARSEMDFGNTHYFFRTESTATFGVGDSLVTLKDTSSDADLYVLYDIDLYPNEGSVTYNTAAGNATWTFPDLEVYAPNGLRTGIITFYETGHSASNQIIVRSGNPYGIQVSKKMSDYVIFKSASGNLIPEEDWQDFFRNYVSFLTYDIRDSKVNDISWYIAENDESQNFAVDLLAQGGWQDTSPKYRIETDRFEKHWGYTGAPSQTRLNFTVDFSETASQVSVSVTDTGIPSTYAETRAGADQHPVSGWVNGGNDASFQKTVDLTAFSKIELQGSNTFSNSASMERFEKNSLVAVGNRVVKAMSGAVSSFGSWSAVVDVSDMTGLQTIKTRTWMTGDYTTVSYVHTGAYGFRDWTGGNMSGVTDRTYHTASASITRAIAYSTGFTRTDKSAIRYSEIWATEQKEEIRVTLTPDPQKVYDGLESRAYLEIFANGDEEVVRNGATISYYKQNGSSWDLVTFDEDVDGKSNCIHQGTYKAVVTFNSAIVNRYTIKGLDSGSTNSVSATFKIMPRPLHLHSLYMEPSDPANNPRNVRSYDGTTAATISDILVDNVVAGDNIKVIGSYPGTYATAQAGETLNPDGTPQSNRLEKLQENRITRDTSVPIVLDGNTYGDYYIASEEYSGAICRALLEVMVKNHRYMYGSESAPGYPTYETTYRADTDSDTWLNISGLAKNDVLTLNSSFKLESLDKNGTPIEFTNRTPVGKYIVEPKGITEANYPILKNYLVYTSNGMVEVYQREIVITAADTDWYEPDEGIPQTHAIFEMLNDDEQTYKAVGNDSTMEYADLHLIGDDTIENTLLVSGTAPTKDAEATIAEFGSGVDLRTVFQNGSNIPYTTMWYVGAPALYVDLETDLSVYECEWCEEYHGFTTGTDHWHVRGYNLGVNQNEEYGDTLSIAEVENPIGEMVQNYTIRYVVGELTVHPPLRFQLEATVPMQVCMYGYAGDGEVVEPDNYGIINYSNGSIQVTDIEVSGDGWLIVDKDPAALLRGEMSMLMKDTQLIAGHNTPRNPHQWVIAADHSEDDSGVEMLIPMSCYIAGGNVNEEGEAYITRVTYTIAEYGITVPEVEGVEIPDVIDGEPVTVVPFEQQK